MTDLCTDLRRVSTEETPKQYKSALTQSLRSSLDQQSPWLVAAEQLSLFPTKRCVQMQPQDWQELSAVLASITRQCASVKTINVDTGSHNSSVPGFAATLELLVRLGQVTSCLLCVNGDDRSFSIARVAQAIRTTTAVLQAAVAQALPAGLSAEVADSLARQRCEQTPLLSAVAWALRQEARALFFNPRPTALSLGTALLDLFRVVEQLWPEGIFVPQQHEAHLDDAAARMADPAAQLALAMLRCAGRAMLDIGPGACKESLLCGLRVGYDMVQQISCLLDAGLLPSDEALVRTLQQSPSLPQLMLALLAVETHRLNQALGVSETDSCILLQRQQQQQQPSQKQPQEDRLDHSSSSRKRGRGSGQPGPGAGDTQQQQPQGLQEAGSARQSRRCSSSLGSPGPSKDLQETQSQQQQQPGLLTQLRRTLSQQRLQQQLQQQQKEEEEHQEIEGAGELHQVWHQVLGMARKNLARDAGERQQEEADDTPRSPLKQLWVSLGLPEGLLALAADAGVSPGPPAQQYVAVCRVGKFLLQGSPLLQPQHGPTSPGRAGSPPLSAAAAVAAAGAAGSQGGQLTKQPSVSAGGRGEQLSPFAGAAARALSRSLSQRAAGLAIPPSWQSSSPARGAAAPAASSPGGAGLYRLASVTNQPESVSSLSPRDFGIAGPAGALSVSAEAAEQLMESCRDFGLKGQEQLELLRLQRVVPVVLLNTAATLLQHHASITSASSSAVAAAAAGANGTAPGTAGGGSSSRTNSGGNGSSSDANTKTLLEDELQVVHAACTAAACVVRCWPVLQRVAAQQEELCDLLAECHPPSGVYAGLTTVCWQQYTLPAEVRLPVLQLLQLVVKLIWQLQPPWQQQQPRNGQLLARGMPQLPQQQGRDGSSSSISGCNSSSVQILRPQSGECIDSLLEVLTSASKLPWELPSSAHSHEHGHGQEPTPQRAVSTAAAGGTAFDDAASDSSSSSITSAGEVDMQLTAEAWRLECQPVAAAVEACLRTAGQVAAAADGALEWKPGGLQAPQASAAARTGPLKVQRHPSAVALGSCLAALCAPFGRPGPLVAAAAAAAPGGPEQQQLFALLTSKVKVLLYNPGSKKAGLIAMHPIEQTPIYIIRQLSSRQHAVSSSSSSPASAVPGSLPGRPAPVLPWMLLLSRLMVLRGKLLGHLLSRDAEGTGQSGATSDLHTSYWHIKMAEESASTLAAHLRVSSADSPAGTQQQGPQQQQQGPQQQQQRQLLAELHSHLLPCLKQAVQVLRAAMKLSRHYHETGFASGFAAGFAAGYAAALAAAQGDSSAAAATPGPVSFVSPWAVLQQGCIRGLPKQLESVGTGLAWQLRHLGCSNPMCVNMSHGSELWLVPAEAAAAGGSSSAGTAGSSSGRGTGAGGVGQEPAGNGSSAAVPKAPADGAAESTRQPQSQPVVLCSSCSKAAHEPRKLTSVVVSPNYHSPTQQ